VFKDLKNAHHRLPWLGTWRIRRRINKVTRRLFKGLRQNHKSLIEYGNLRRGKPWGMKESNQLSWIFMVDLLSDRPLIYKITYNLYDGRYSCYSRSGGKNEMMNVLQFTSDDIDELVARLTMLAAEIPAMRERMLRQYLYTLRQEKTPKRWLDFFKRPSHEEEMQSVSMLRDVIQSMLVQKKISKHEALKLMAYAETLQDD